jgi:adenine-specific DNA-methyltransferase
MSFNTKLINLLKTNPHLVDDEGELLIAAVQDKAWKIDHDLIKLLLSDEEIKGKFFDEIEGHWVFNINTFLEYITQKNFLVNSYTRFRNRIGLTIDEKYLKERGEVSLVWPYKDCVLEGGQTKEEEKRKEIFFNEVLAQDEINRMFDPKVLTNFTRYTTAGAEPVKEIKRDENGVIRENLIIKGNNLLALHTLKQQFRGKVKLIYIDPPYNTGNDSFCYNDNFNHSTWLTFMKNRLSTAKNLLHKKGCIFIQLDDKEIGYTRVLLDEIFHHDNYVNQIVFSTNSPFGFKSTSNQLFKQAGYILVYAKSRPSFIMKDIYVERNYDKAYHLVFDDITLPESKWKWRDISDVVANELGFQDKKSAVKKIGEDDFLSEISLYAIENAERVFRTAAVSGGALIKRKKTIEKSRKQRNEIVRHPNDDMDYIFIGGERVIFYSERLTEIDGQKLPGTIITDIWDDIPIEGISKEGRVNFSRGKKPEYLLKRIIEMTTEVGDLVLDFCFGSGTTGAVAHKLGRQYIGIEQLNYGENDSVVRLNNVINGDTTGISKSVNWIGGGDFIYCELMKYNQVFMERIQELQSSEGLLQIWQEMAESSFLNWYVNPQMPDEAVNYFISIGEEENGLEKQKKLLAELLDKNQLYVNLSEINDAKFKVSEEDKALNKAFYGEI